MTPVEVAETAMQKFVFDLLREFGTSFAIVAVILGLVWKVVPELAKIIPELAKVVIEKYRAETDLVRKTQEVVASLPAVFSEFKTAMIAELRAGHSQIKESIGADTDRRIEDKVDKIARKVSQSEPDSDPPPVARSSRTG